MPGTTPHLSIRATTSADLAVVDALLARSYPVLLKPDYPPSVLVTALPRISRAQPALLACGTYFLAEREGQALGAGGWTRGAPGGGEERDTIGHIRHVVTDHHATRQGVGRVLMQHIIDDARASGITTLHCQSTLTAVPFYAAMGFVAQREITVDLLPGIGFPAVFMIAPLSRDA